MEEESPPQPDSIHPQPAMESRDENPQRVSPQFDEVDIRQSIRSADEPITEESDRLDEEGSIPVPPKLDDGGERRSPPPLDCGARRSEYCVRRNLMAGGEDEPQVYERDERVSSLKEEEGKPRTVVAMEEEKAPVVEPSCRRGHWKRIPMEKSPDREISLLAAGDEKEARTRVTVEAGEISHALNLLIDEIMQENAEEKPLPIFLNPPRIKNSMGKGHYLLKEMRKFLH
ncbi:uncharacterized protein A4U43_C08F120 [Asparagus officinalis]|nr:uncharacterized protein A4U43_C08F120 [Asparagus officinalis]